MSTQLCPVCEAELKQSVCPTCGYDASCDCERYPTLGPVPEALASASGRRRVLQGERVTQDDAVLCLRRALLDVKAMLNRLPDPLLPAVQDFSSRIDAFLRQAEAFSAPSSETEGTAATALPAGHDEEVSIPAAAFRYSDEEKGVLITGYTGTESDIAIPASIQDRPVIGIAASAFSFNRQLEAVSIPDSVLTLGSSAFYGCGKLCSVTLSNKLTAIENSTFRGCCNLRQLIVPEGVRSVGNSAFVGCASLYALFLPVSLNSIDSFAFQGCGSLRHIYYAGSAAQWMNVHINNYFHGNRDLKSANIHFNVSDPTVMAAR